MRDMDDLFGALAKSKFRSRFRLSKKELNYLQEKGLAAILDHARDFIEERLAPAEPVNDGKQTPMRNHPVFVAQHATATCCRGCLEKWHYISRGVALTERQKAHIAKVIEQWLRENSSQETSGQGQLF